MAALADFAAVWHCHRCCAVIHAFSVSVNGQAIASNIQIKPRTYLNTIGTHHYNASTGWCEINIGTASEIQVAVSYFDTQAYDVRKQRRGMGGGTVTLGNIPQIPNVSISENSKTHNSIKILLEQVMIMLNSMLIIMI